MRPTALLLRLLIAWLMLAVAACVWERFILLWQIVSSSGGEHGLPGPAKT